VQFTPQIHSQIIHKETFFILIHKETSYGNIFFFFFDKEYILISQRYQLHPASATTQCPKDLRMHTALKQMEEQEENNNKEINSEDIYKANKQIAINKIDPLTHQMISPT
jgi:hypothetical protein